jgi:hypothetical protein
MERNKMNKLIDKIKTLNVVYKSMSENFTTLKKMFKNHSTIKQKIHLAEEMTNQIYMTILEKFEELETKREFLHIVKDIKKNEQKKCRK